MVISPDLPSLPFSLRNGVKCFEIIAQPVQREILSGLYINAWGYNGSTPGPTIHVYTGDYVNIRVINRLPESTSVHRAWFRCSERHGWRPWYDNQPQDWH